METETERVEWRLVPNDFAPRGVLRAYRPRAEGEKPSTKDWIKFPITDPKTSVSATFKVWLDNCWESSPINDGL